MNPVVCLRILVGEDLVGRLGSVAWSGGSVSDPNRRVEGLELAPSFGAPPLWGPSPFEAPTRTTTPNRPSHPTFKLKCGVANLVCPKVGNAKKCRICDASVPRSACPREGLRRAADQPSNSASIRASTGPSREATALLEVVDCE